MASHAVAIDLCLPVLAKTRFTMVTSFPSRSHVVEGASKPAGVGSRGGSSIDDVATWRSTLQN